MAPVSPGLRLLRHELRRPTSRSAQARAPGGRGSEAASPLGRWVRKRRAPRPAGASGVDGRGRCRRAGPGRLWCRGPTETGRPGLRLWDLAALLPFSASRLRRACGAPKPGVCSALIRLLDAHDSRPRMEGGSSITVGSRMCRPTPARRIQKRTPPACSHSFSSTPQVESQPYPPSQADFRALEHNVFVTRAAAPGNSRIGCSLSCTQPTWVRSPGPRRGRDPQAAPLPHTHTAGVTPECRTRRNS